MLVRSRILIVGHEVSHTNLFNLFHKPEIIYVNEMKGDVGMSLHEKEGE